MGVIYFSYRSVIVMQISSRFTIAVHVFTCIDVFKGDYKITSDFLASSVNVNPVVIRRIMQQLKTAGLIEVRRGTGGIEPTRPLDEITFFDIYKAVECVDNGELFHFHEDPNPQCPVGRNIHAALNGRLNEVQEVMENEMKRITLREVVCATKERISSEN